MRGAMEWVGRKVAAVGVVIVAVGVAIRMWAEPRKARRIAGRPRSVPRKDWGPS